jgi:phage terminase large subunit
MLWDHRLQEWTDRGESYIATLDRLTGVRYKRLRLGLWVAAEGQVYDAWDPAIHIVNRAEVADSLRTAWHIGAVDWGWTNPGTIQIWAVDSDGRMYLVVEHYHTRKPVDSWWIPRALQLDERYQVRQWVCDPAEPAYIAQFQAAGLSAVGAKNDILPGITAMQDRLIVQGDGRPRLMALDDALLERDERLAEDDAKPPVCFTQELPLYVWAKNVGGQTLKDKPVDAFNHAMDTARYAVAALDLGGAGLLTDELRTAFSWQSGAA